MSEAVDISLSDLDSGLWFMWKSLSRVQLFATPWTIQSTEFSRQEYWSGLPFPSPSWQTDGEIMEAVTDSIFLGSKITADGNCSHEIKTLAPWKKSYDKSRQHIKKQRHYFLTKICYSQSYGFSIHVWMWELDYEEGWEPKNWCFWTVVFGEDSWESLGLQEDPTSPS